MWFFSSRKTPRPAPSPARRPSFRPWLEALEDRRLMTAGVLDPTFGNGGVDKVAGVYSGRDVAVQGDGKVIAIGWTNTTGRLFELVRTNTNGSLDTSFGSGGVVTTAFQKYPDYGEALALQGNGQIVAAGVVTVSVKGVQVQENGLARYNSNGTLDSTFGYQGKVMTSGTGGIEGMALQADGKIVTVGSSGGGDVALCRYNSNGSLDSTFGTGGKVFTDFFGQDDDGHSLKLQADGRVVVSGYAGQMVNGSLVRHAVLLRYNADGSLDTSFGTGGKVFSDAFYASLGFEHDNPTVALQSVNGVTKILLGGVTAVGTTNFLIARYNGDGSLDTTFGTGGQAQTNVSTYAELDRLAVQADGKIVAVGDAGSATNGLGNIAVARFNVNGTLDSTFGTGGLVTTVIDPQNGSVAAGVAIQPDGRIVVVGFCNNNLVLLRYLASEPQIGSFTANPNPVTAGSNVTLTASNITDGNPNSTITQVAFYADSNNNGVLEPGVDTLLGYGTKNSDGTWTLTFSTSGWTSGSHKLFAQAQDSYGVFGDPLAFDLGVL